MAWIFQGNPKRFDIDDYLGRYSFIYWNTPTNQRKIAIGDRAFIWRSGELSGLVAIDTVKELPVPRSDVQTPEVLGDDLWVSQQDEPSEVKVGIEIEEIRLTLEEGLFTREILKNHPVFSKNRIITNPVGTVFRLNSEEVKILVNLWGTGYSEDNTTGFAVTEGTLQLKSHYRRERSRKLISLKKEQCKSLNGLLRCEICGLSFVETYPKSLGEHFIEVHHKTPLSQIKTTVRITLDDLLLVCANCHRMIHRIKHCEQNLKLLLNHFSSAKYKLINDN